MSLRPCGPRAGQRPALQACGTHQIAWGPPPVKHSHARWAGRWIRTGEPSKQKTEAGGAGQKVLVRDALEESLGGVQTPVVGPAKVPVRVEDGIRGAGVGGVQRGAERAPGEEIGQRIGAHAPATRRVLRALSATSREASRKSRLRTSPSCETRFLQRRTRFVGLPEEHVRQPGQQTGRDEFPQEGDARILRLGIADVEPQVHFGEAAVKERGHAQNAQLVERKRHQRDKRLTALEQVQFDPFGDEGPQGVRVRFPRPADQVRPVGASEHSGSSFTGILSHRVRSGPRSTGRRPPDSGYDRRALPEDSRCVSRPASPCSPSPFPPGPAGRRPARRDAHRDPRTTASSSAPDAPPVLNPEVVIEGERITAVGPGGCHPRSARAPRCWT